MKKGRGLVIGNIFVAGIIVVLQVVGIINFLSQFSKVKSVFEELGVEVSNFKICIGLGLQIFFVVGLASLIWFCAHRLKTGIDLSQKEKTFLIAVLILQILLFLGSILYSIYSIMMPVYNIQSSI